MATLREIAKICFNRHHNQETSHTGTGLEFAVSLYSSRWTTSKARDRLFAILFLSVYALGDRSAPFLPCLVLKVQSPPLLRARPDSNEGHGVIKLVGVNQSGPDKSLVNLPGQDNEESRRRSVSLNANAKAKSKGKKKKSNDSDVDEPPPSITYYIFIPKLPAVTAKKRGNASKAAGDDNTIQKGPFSLPMSEPYSALLSAIATELPCRKEHINESKIVWKPKKPKNAEKLPLSKAAGYKAMLDEMKDKAEGSRQVLLYMPAPAKPMDDQTPWETDGDPEPSCDYSELEPTLPSDSIIAQKQSFNKATKDERAKLEEKYPVGNYPQFPDLRVYRDPSTGFYYELNTMRSGVWASAMVCSRQNGREYATCIQIF
ncbi:hypothetical protein B0H14DRAFT_2589886 [Mycena olivaceomarginata]|nr:hypothetical protein B0H14DRAFT_2589886 [Mycena olivaceomarginata]